MRDRQGVEEGIFVLSRAFGWSRFEIESLPLSRMIEHCKRVMKYRG